MSREGERVGRGLLRRLTPTSVGGRVALAVNSLVVITAIGFLAFDYHRESHQRLADKAASLREQALTFHLAVAGYTGEPAARQQRFIDEVCGRMSEDDSPGHHLVVEIDGRVLQSQAHQRASDELLAAVRAAADADHPEDAELIVGRHAEGGVAVYVAERMPQVRSDIRRQAVARSVGVLAFCLLLAGAVNVIVRRLVHSPLRRLVRTIDGIAAGDYGTSAGRFGAAELARLAGAVDAMSRALCEAAARRRLALDQARRVQENLLPRSGEVSPGVHLAATHRPAEAVAGDYYDVFPLPDGTVACCVADVVGHGVPAAMVAAILKVLILDAVEVDADPGAVVRRVNARFAAVAPPECFASLLVARWCPERQTLWYASAGHEPGFLLTDAPTPILLEATGTLLGVMPDGTWDTASAPAPHGSVLIGLTDGVTEAMDAGGHLFGRGRMVEVICGVSRVSPAGIVAAVDQAVDGHTGGHPSADDYTLMAVRLGGESFTPDATG